jgi:hypothetical protein
MWAQDVDVGVSLTCATVSKRGKRRWKRQCLLGDAMDSHPARGDDDSLCTNNSIRGDRELDNTVQIKEGVVGLWKTRIDKIVTDGKEVRDKSSQQEIERARSKREREQEGKR